MQTLVLLVVNHDESGGKSPPSVYRQFLGLFSFAAIDISSFIPGAWYGVRGVGCVVWGAWCGVRGMECVVWHAWYSFCV